MKHTLMTALVAGALALPAAATAESWAPYPAEKVVPPFSTDGTTEPVTYEPLKKADKPYNICVSFPHMKDPYWLGVDYGVVEQAKDEGVKLHVVAADGYTNLNQQISQIQDCVSAGAQAVVVGAISYTGLNGLIGQMKEKGIPWIDVINGVSSEDIAAKSLVSFYTMGAETGKYLAEKHPAGSDPVKVGWFPGPAGAGWVEAANKGFLAAVKGSAVQVLEPKYGDTGKEAQLKLVEDELQSNPDLSYIVGTAVTADVAQSLLRQRGLSDKTKVLAFYMTPDVYTGIQRGRILAAPADSMVIQGRIAVDQAVRILEGKDYIKHVGPKIFVVDGDNIDTVSRDAILPPKGFRPVFTVN